MLKELFNNVSEPFKSDTLFIIKTYMDAGYECYVVGGPIRDLLNGLNPKDIDLSTNCPLEVTEQLFKNVIPTGLDHGTLTIHINGENYEVTIKELSLEDKVNASLLLGIIDCSVLREVLYILETETVNSCLVGGAVRDAMMGLKPKDWDFVTSTPYDDLKQIFLNHNFSVKETGANFLILMVVKDGQEFEIANYRTDKY